MADGLIQIGFFLVMFAIPCAVFVLSTIVAGELRDFFESTTLSLTAHLIVSTAFAVALYRFVHGIITAEHAQYLGLIVNIEYGLIVCAWVLGAHGCLYGEQAPSKRIGPRGLKRYR